MKYFCVSISVLMFAASALMAQSTSPSTCVASAVPPLVRVEGIAERLGDLVYHCSGLPNIKLTGNFTITLNVGITNRLSTGTTITGIVFTADSGSGPQAVVVQPQLVNRNTLVFNGLSIAFSPLGSAELRIAGLRGNASQLITGAQIIAGLAINGAGRALTTSQLVVGTPQRGLYAGFSTKLILTEAGSPLPDAINFSSLLAATTFASTRFTEGFADAFGIATDFNGVSADSGQRVIIRYGGFPSDARLFVPDVIAGSDTVQPTAGGDFGPAASGGYYTPSVNGTLLLARVNGAAANGAGGGPVYTPGPFGSGIVSFNTVTELQIINGSAYVVYEAVDSNASSVESAQFPTFLGLPYSSTRSFIQTISSISLAPNSTVTAVSLTEPLPRFAGVDPPPDCGIIGDCQTALPQLLVDTTPQQLSTTVGGPTVQSFFTIRNGGGGTLRWSAIIGYGTTPGWLSLDAYSGSGGVNVRVFAAPGNLVPATYQAAIIIDAGVAGTKTVLVTFIVAAAAAPTKP